MKASLSVEAIGHDTIEYLRWGSNLLDDCGLPGKSIVGNPVELAGWGVWDVREDRKVKRMIYGRTDYSNANSKGSRGVRIWYTLESGHLYFVRSPTSWRNVDEFYCRVNDEGDIERE